MELISWINERFIKANVVTDVPTFGRWTDNDRELAAAVHYYRRGRSNQLRLDVMDLVRFARRHDAQALALCHPNNPTGALLGREEVLCLLDHTRNMEFVVIDESFIDFVSARSIPSVTHDAIDHDNVIVIKSLGKNLGLHGLRCGFAVACRELTTQLRSMLPPWNVNALAEELIRMMATCGRKYEAARKKTVQDSKAFE